MADKLEPVINPRLLPEPGRQGGGDEETGGETGQVVGEAGGVPESSNILLTAGARRRHQGKLHSDR